jgi:hypothetical protein
MKNTRFHLKSLLALPLVASLFWLTAPVLGQTAGARDTMQPQEQHQTMPPQYRDDDITHRQLADFDHFMDSHPEIAEQLRKDPSLVDNREFVEKHPALQSYLQEHPGVREEIKENPDRFMRAENRYDRHENRRDGDTTRRELAGFDRFMDGHPELAEQLRKDPSLLDNREFVEKHPALQTYLQEHPGAREEIKENPDAFMRAENRYDRQEDRRDDRRDGDITHRELASFDRFADSHPEIGEQLRKDPSLVDNREFVEKHPALQTYLQEHPGVREEIKEDPNSFMRAEARYDRYEDRRDRDPRGETASFGQFLGGHSNIADELSKDPSLVKNQEYMANHPELQEYLKAHPAAQAELKQNPESFIKSSQQFSTTPQVKTPPVEPKPKQ